MRSASALIALLALAALSGCTTTQQQAAWVRLNSARLRATQFPVRVSRPGFQVAVERVSAVTAHGRSAIVVRVRNLDSRALSDLPISVGTIEPSGKRTYLNSAAGLDYFQTHLPALPAHGLLTWVYTTREQRRGTHVFATVGIASGPAPGELPKLGIAWRALHRGGLRVTVVNRSSIPQYQLPVYATAERHGAYVAAGQASVATLAGGSSISLRVPLTGKPDGAGVELGAPPTIFN